MNKILAVFRKEYKETRITTLVFLLVGLLFPLIKLFGLYPDSAISSSLVNADPFAFGGILALWLNASILCAIAFARERESETFETLRRATPDWRVAAAGKFGYALFSSLALAAFFGIASIGAAKVGGHKPFEAFRLVLELNSSDGPATLVFVFAIATVCWGVFWTSRCARQMAAIFGAFLCPLLISAIAGLIVMRTLGTDQRFVGKSFIETIVGVVSILALVAAPFKKRFGYRETEQSVASESTDEELETSWENVDLDQKKPRSFPTLLSLAFTDAAILFRSPVSILYELAILCAVCVVGYYFSAPYIAIPAFALYYLSFATGLFLDSKRKNSIVQERLSVKPGAYWLANALAAFLVATIVFVAFEWFFANIRSGGSNKIVPLEIGNGPERVLIAPLLLLYLGISLWSAALNVSRLIVGTITLAVSVLATFCLVVGFTSRVAVFLLNYLYGDLSTFSNTALYACLLLFTAAGLIFTVASYRIVTRRAINRKAPLSVAVPLILIIAIAAFVISPASAPLPPKLRLWELDRASLPQSREEYDKLVAKTKKNLESVGSSALFETSEQTDAVAVELNDLRERFLDACESTKKHASTFVDVDRAEYAFYSALRDAFEELPETVEPNGLEKFLEEIPSLRPSPKQRAENAYLFALYGNLESGVKSSDAASVIAKARAKNNRVWKIAFWNSIQFMPDEFQNQLIRASKSKVDDELTARVLTEQKGKRWEEIDPHYEKKKDSFMNKNVLFRNMDEYKEYGWALSPGSQLERNEFQRRRLLYLIYEHKP